MFVFELFKRLRFPFHVCCPKTTHEHIERPFCASLPLRHNCRFRVAAELVKFKEIHGIVSASLVV